MVHLCWNQFPILKWCGLVPYEVDLRLGELRKNGIRVKLTGQPFQILVILLEHPGDLVTREQLQRRLWPSDTFVDFDRGLNAAINRVREALGTRQRIPALWRLCLGVATVS